MLDVSSVADRLSAVVSHRPGYDGSVIEGRLEVDVRGGTCRDMVVCGARATEAILELEMLL